LIVLGLAAAGLLLYEYWEPLSAFFTDLGHRLATEFKPELDELHATLISAGDGFKYLWDAMGLGDGPFKNTEKGLRRINEAAEIVAASLKMAELSLRFIIDPFGAAKQIYTDYTAAKSSSGKGAPAASGIVGGTVGGAIRAFSSLFTAGEGGYNSVNLGQRFGYRSSIADLGGMTIDEVLAAQHAKQFNAAGHYQIIPSTLEGAKAALHLSGNEKFDKATQDRIFAQYLITTKQKDVGAYISGKSDNLKAALMGLAREWASFTDPDTGGSHYAGQHASVSLAKEIAVLNSLRAHNHKTYPTDKNPPEQQQGAGFMQTVHIGAITVNTQATDARGIADSLRSTLSYNDLAAQANGIGAVR
jgi:hypothetical protein